MVRRPAHRGLPTPEPVLPSRPSYRPLSLASLASLLGLGLALAGCPAGSGATCQLTSDCAAGLSCCNDGLPRGTCQSTCPERADAALDDAGATDDAGQSTDASQSTDAGQSTDAASSEDASSSPDAASTADGGS
jgi:hypothetical protein